MSMGAIEATDRPRTQGDYDKGEKMKENKIKRNEEKESWKEVRCIQGLHEGGRCGMPEKEQSPLCLLGPCVTLENS